MFPTPSADLFPAAGPMMDGVSGEFDGLDFAPDEFGDWWLDLGFVAVPPAAGGV